jgi:UDP-GlcNAc:undecaprenyl-phosphate/decaprenyl-phosphate GlcNAc-1-phosphate transferase
MSRLPIRSAAAAAVAAAIARLSYAGLRRRPPGGDRTWSRTNHRGEPVTLLEGPAITLGGMAGTLLVPGLPRRSRAAMLIAGAGAAALGCYDDLAGSGSSRGFRGHLGALRRGELTTGAVKLAGIGVTGLAASALLRGIGTPGSGPAPAARTAPGSGTTGTTGTPGAGAWDAADLLINAGLVAGGANLLNLFDLRPGRALKVAFAAGALLAAAPGPGRQAVAAPLGAAAALLPDDLGERAMLGDGGANALGALLGTAAAVTLPRPARLVTLAAVAGLTAASEVVSFTRVIERTRPLRWLDMLGRRPVAAPAPGTAVPRDQPEPAAPTSPTPR